MNKVSEELLIVARELVAKELKASSRESFLEKQIKVLTDESQKAADDVDWDKIERVGIDVDEYSKHFI